MTGGPSLRKRLVLGVVSALVLLQVLSCIAVYFLQQRMLYDRFDQSLVASARALLPLIKHDEKKGLHFDFERIPLPEFQAETGSDYFQLWVRDGQIVARSRTLGESELRRPAAIPAADTPAIQELPLPKNQQGRAALLALEVPMKGPPERRGPPASVIMMVARSTAGVEADLGMLAWTLAGTAAGVTLVSALVGWIVVSGGLRPLRRLSEQIATIGSERLNQPLPVQAQPIEVRPVVERLNEMLVRLRAAFERERSFTADVAHELRTPLAGIRSVGEVALADKQEAAEYRRDLEEIVGLAGGMQATVEKLLMLARMDAGQVRLEPMALNLSEVVEVSLEQRRDRLAQRRLRVEHKLPRDLEILADADLLCLILNNILDNACDYADEGGQISIAATSTQSGVKLIVANTGCTLSADQVREALGRFWRGDAARNVGQGHVGLGLSLVERAATILGGRVVATLPKPGVFVIEIELPEAAGKHAGPESPEAPEAQPLVTQP